MKQEEPSLDSDRRMLQRCYRHYARYVDKQGLVQEHLRKLLDIHSIRSINDIKEMCRLYDRLQVNIRGLKALRVSSDTYAVMLHRNLLRALPEEVALRYHQQVALDKASRGNSNSSERLTTYEITNKQALESLLMLFNVKVECHEKKIRSKRRKSQQ